jgi:hypothetical protein
MANLRVDKITSTETFERTGSVQFHQDNDNYLSGTITAIGTQDFTIECWVLLLANRGAHQRIFGNEDGAFDSNTLNMRFTPNLAIQMYYGEGDVTSHTLLENRWYHIAMSYSDNVARCYIDGKEFGAIPGNTDLGNTTMFIGGTYTVGGENFNGHISNARLIVGKGIYPENFKPPMRELEVTPETVLLACQSKTDKLEERSGNTTLSATGTLHSASELTPGLLTPVPKAGAGSAITGSVEFSGGTTSNPGDYLSVPNTEDLRLGSSDFTVEAYVNFSNGAISNGVIVALWDNTNNQRSWNLYFDRANGLYFAGSTNGSSGDNNVNASIDIEDSEWYHVAACRSGSTVKLFVNGVERASNTSVGTYYDNTTDLVTIGAQNHDNTTNYWKGFISNLRVVKGTALYTDDFIPPTRELKKVPGTVLLCCQDSNDPTQEVTGKTISLNSYFTYDAIVTYCIVDVIGTPPPTIPLVAFATELVLLTPVPKFPKEVASPVDAIVI